MSARETSQNPAASIAVSQDEGPRLRRSVTLPMLVLYGLGVTVGAGIFALVGEILSVAGAMAPAVFVIAGVVVAMTGVTYMHFVRHYPQAGGEAVYVHAGLGVSFARLAGLLVIVAATVSSAVVALAFGGYLGEVLPISPRVAALIVVAGAVALACRGIQESVGVAAVVTFIEVGALCVVIALGVPDLLSADLASSFSEPPTDGYPRAIASGAVLAFFAFIGFETIASLAEETQDAERNAPRAIAWTLALSLVLYLLVSTLAVVLPDRSSIIESDAPMARLFEISTGLSGQGIALVATVAMTNGILIQIMVAARVAFGLADEGLLPRQMAHFADIDKDSGTPRFATVIVGCVVAVLLMSAALGDLARWTSIAILAIFALVNASLVRLYRGDASKRALSLNAAAATLLTSGLAAWQTVDIVASLVE